MLTARKTYITSRILALLLVIVFTAGLFVGCTKDKPLPTTESATQTEPSVNESEDNGDRLAMGWLTKDLGSEKHPANINPLRRESATIETKSGAYYTAFLVSDFTITEESLEDGLAKNEKTSNWQRVASYEETATPRLFSVSPNETDILTTYSVTARSGEDEKTAAYIKIGYTNDSANVKGPMSVQADFTNPIENGIDQETMYEILKSYVGEKLASLLVYMRDLDRVDRNKSQLGEASCYEEIAAGNGIYVIERTVDYENGYDVSAVHFKVHIEEPDRKMAYDLSPEDYPTKGDDVRYDVGSMFSGRLGTGRMYGYQDSMKDYFELGSLEYKATGVTGYTISEKHLFDGTTDYTVSVEFVKGDASKTIPFSVTRKTNEDESGVVKSYEYNIIGTVDVISATEFDGEEDAAYDSLIKTASEQLTLIFGEKVPLERSYFAPSGDGALAADLSVLFAFSGDTIAAKTHIELRYNTEAEVWTGMFVIEGANTITHEH